MLYKVIFLHNIKLIEFLNFSNFKLFLIKNNELFFYIKIPSFIFIIKKENKLLLSLKEIKFKDFFYNYFYFFSNWLKNIQKPILKKLIFKGLGLKVKIFSNILELKLGFSHLILINLKNYNLKLQVFKNILFVEGYSLLEVGTFLNKIYSLKKPNVYKGKGIWYKNQKFLLKSFVKKK